MVTAAPAAPTPKAPCQCAECSGARKANEEAVATAKAKADAKAADAAKTTSQEG